MTLPSLGLLFSIALATAACGSDDDPGTSSGGGGASSTAQDFGDLEGQPFEALSSTAGFNEVADRGYVSVSINGWPESCSMDPVCGKAQLNFTLYAIGGSLDDIQPGIYDVTSTVEGDVTFEISGAAGFYEDDCSTGDGFDRFESGTLTLTSASGGRVKGEVDFTLETGETLSGPFDAIDCTP
jgi:hypothetical protein